MALVQNEDFKYILRLHNTNVDGKKKIMFAPTSIKGIGPRFANIICKKADVDMNKRCDHVGSVKKKEARRSVSDQISANPYPWNFSKKCRLNPPVRM